MITAGLIYLLLGALAGFASGLLGIGGGIVIVPVMVSLAALSGAGAAQAFPVAVATSSLVVFFNSMSSIAAHLKRGSVDLSWVRALGPWCIVGAVGGALLTQALDRYWLVAVVAFVQVVIASLIFHSTLEPDASPAAGSGTDAVPGHLMGACGGLAIGAMSAAAGIAGGTLLTPLMTLRGLAVHRAAGSSAALGLAIGGGAAATFLIVPALGSGPARTGLIDLTAAGLMILGGFFAARVGVGAAHAWPKRTLKRILAFLLLASSIGYSGQALTGIGKPGAAKARPNASMSSPAPRASVATPKT